jgi:hypothetical protein
MRLLLVGASETVARQFHDRAAAYGLRLVHSARVRRPTWAIVATAAQRGEALRRFRLPADRVVLVPAIAAHERLPEDLLERGLARMTELGPWRPLVSAAGVWLTRRALPWIETALERTVGAEAETPARLAAEKLVRAAAKDAVQAVDPKKAQRSVERRALRHAERAAAKAQNVAAVASRDEERLP